MAKEHWIAPDAFADTVFIRVWYKKAELFVCVCDLVNEEDLGLGLTSVFAHVTEDIKQPVAGSSRNHDERFPVE